MWKYIGIFFFEFHFVMITYSHSAQINNEELVFRMEWNIDSRATCINDKSISTSKMNSLKVEMDGLNEWNICVCAYCYRNLRELPRWLINQKKSKRQQPNSKRFILEIEFLICRMVSHGVRMEIHIAFIRQHRIRAQLPRNHLHCCARNHFATWSIWELKLVIIFIALSDFHAPGAKYPESFVSAFE